MGGDPGSIIRLKRPHGSIWSLGSATRIASYLGVPAGEAKGTARRRAGHAFLTAECFISDVGDNMPMASVLAGKQLRRHTGRYMHTGVAKSAGGAASESCSNLRMPFPCDIVRVDSFKARAAIAGRSNSVGHQCMTQVCSLESAACSNAESKSGVESLGEHPETRRFPNRAPCADGPYHSNYCRHIKEAASRPLRAQFRVEQKTTCQCSLTHRAGRQEVPSGEWTSEQACGRLDAPPRAGGPAAVAQGSGRS
jgi:hypothetical protein